MTAVYRFVLAIFPAEFRRRHGAAMIAQFGEQRRLVRGRPVATAALWIRAVVDAIRHGVAIRFGGPDTRPPSPSAWPTDLRQAWRSVMARRGAAGISIALLALALTTATTMFCVVDALVLRPVPFPDPKALVILYGTDKPGVPGLRYLPKDLSAFWAQRSDLFTAVGAYYQGGTALIGASDEAREQLGQVFVTPGVFAVLGVRPILGRTFSAADTTPGNDRQIVVSESLWRSRLGHDAGAIGRQIVVNDTPMTVIGVMPASFGFPISGVRLWRSLDLSSPSVPYAEIVARARDGLSRDVLRQRVEAEGDAVMAQSTGRSVPRHATLQGFEDQGFVDDRARQSIWLLAAATILLLVTAGANMSSLTLSQSAARTRDMAIQSALGATRLRLLRQALIEQCLIGATGFALATPLIFLCIAAARALMPEQLTRFAMHLVDVDIRALVVLGALALLTPVVAGLIPALAGSKTSVIDVLKHEGRSATAGRASRALRQLLVVVEVACAVVLLVGGALLVRSFMRLQTVDRGFDTNRLVCATLQFPAHDFPSALSRRLFLDRALEVLPSQPGVEAATISGGMPPQGGQTNYGPMTIEGRPAPDSRILLPGYTVRPDFFAVAGIPLIEGRPFREDEPDSSVIISASMAAAFWHGTSPIGQHYRLDDSSPWQDVIGVAGEVKSGTLDDARSPYEVYYPYVLRPVGSVSATPVASSRTFSGQSTIVVRAREPRTAIAAVRAALIGIDRHVLIATLAPVEELYGQTLVQQRLVLTLMVVFSLVGLAVAAIGIYGVLSSLVAQQLREIGVRIMLGAEPAAMSRGVVMGGLRLAAIGAVAGVAIAVAGTRLITSVLYGIRASDPTSYLVVLAVIGLAVVLAARQPARRAARVDPATLLREA